MSFLKNIMSPFVEFKEDPTKPASNENKQKSKENKDYTTVNAPSSSGVSSSPASGSSKPEIKRDYQQHFEDLIEEANAKNPLFQGTDFKEFIDSKIDVEAIADEATRYKTAFNVLKRTGLTKERLVSTGQQYIDLIESDLKGFTNAYAQQYKNDVEQNELSLQRKAAELQELNEKIASLSSEIKNVSQEIKQSKDQLNSNKEAFVMAGENKKKEIETELQKINQYF